MDPKLSSTAQRLVQDASNEVLISPASYWEIAIKASLGKWKLNQSFEDLMSLCLDQYGFQILPILPRHAPRLISLPFPPKHNDPFDRLLVAQALVEGIPILSADTKLDAYPMARVW